VTQDAAWHLGERAKKFGERPEWCNENDKNHVVVVETVIADVILT